MWISMTLWTLVIIYIWTLCSTGATIILENRQPAKTIAWVVVIWCIPIVGLIFYYFFGSDIHRKYRVHQCDYDCITKQMLNVCENAKQVDIPSKYTTLVTALQKTHHAVVSCANRVKIFYNGRQFIEQLLKDIQAAQKHVHLEMYIFEEDAVGKRIAEALKKKVREGVEVRLLFDDVGCWKVKDKFFKSIAAAGVKVRAFQPVRFPALTNKVNYRNHRKIVVIDGQQGYIGGMNIAERYAPENGAEWRDAQLRIEGESVADLQRLFLTDWYLVTQKLLAYKMYFPLPTLRKANCLTQIVPSTPFSDFPQLQYSITWIFQNARRSIDIQTPYFMPNAPMLQAIQTAAIRGVKVRIMLPVKPDSKLLRYGNESYYEDVLKAGVEIYLYTGGFLHSKIFTVDEEICSIGSANMDIRSYSDNFEANAFIYNKEVAKEVKQQFEIDLQCCEEVCYEQWKQRKVWRKVMESHTRLLSPLL